MRGRRTSHRRRRWAGNRGLKAGKALPPARERDSIGQAFGGRAQSDQEAEAGGDFASRCLGLVRVPAGEVLGRRSQGPLVVAACTLVRRSTALLPDRSARSWARTGRASSWAWSQTARSAGSVVIMRINSRSRALVCPTACNPAATTALDNKPASPTASGAGAAKQGGADQGMVRRDHGGELRLGRVSACGSTSARQGCCHGVSSLLVTSEKAARLLSPLCRPWQ